MAVNYTAGNYTVKSLYVDSKAHIAVSRSVPNIDWSQDYSTKSIDKDKCELVNRTGLTLDPTETMTIARTDLGDIYKGSNVDAAHRLADTRGTRVMIQSRVQYSATNSATGEEFTLPARAWICVETPVAPMVKQDIPMDAVNRVLGALANMYAEAPSAPVTAMPTLIGAIKGDLSPRYVNNEN